MLAPNGIPLLRRACLILLLVVSFSHIHAQTLRIETEDSQALFKSRADIDAPRWNITVHDQERLSPGYWFIAPYDGLDASTPDASRWTAPTIFDQDGELVWVGEHAAPGYGIYDFRVSNVLGEDMLTFLWPQSRSAVVLDGQYNMFKQLEISSPEKELDNMHELNFVDNGTRALIFYSKTKNATKLWSEDIGFNGTCLIREDIFREANLMEDWRFVYRWDASKRIDGNETTHIEGTLDQRCNETAGGWDWIQANSVDRINEDGSYVLSARYSNTIYRIERSGDIVWRLGGDKSDFEADFTFARQNHVRIVSHDSTHMVLSIFDNGHAEDLLPDGTADTSRGLLVSLNTAARPMTATLLAEYANPLGSSTPDQGSIQVLPDGNVFAGWVDNCMLSEHDADGTLLMEAHVQQAGLKSYRSYKFPFVGLPTRPPDVYAEVSEGDVVKTTVYASWNGATEITHWNVSRATSEGRSDGKEPAVSVPRSGFETKMELDGVAMYVVVEALDRDGMSLGRSNVFETARTPSLPAEELEAETQRLEAIPPPMQDEKQEEQASWKDTATSAATSRSGIGSFLVVVALLAAMFFAIRYWRRRRRGGWAAKHNSRPSYELTGRPETMYALGESDDEDDGTEKERRMRS